MPLVDFAKLVMYNVLAREFRKFVENMLGDDYVCFNENAKFVNLGDIKDNGECVDLKTSERVIFTRSLVPEKEKLVEKSLLIYLSPGREGDLDDLARPTKPKLNKVIDALKKSLELRPEDLRGLDLLAPSGLSVQEVSAKLKELADEAKLKRIERDARFNSDALSRFAADRCISERHRNPTTCAAYIDGYSADASRVQLTIDLKKDNQGNVVEQKTGINDYLFFENIGSSMVIDIAKDFQDTFEKFDRDIRGYYLSTALKELLDDVSLQAYSIADTYLNMKSKSKKLSQGFLQDVVNYANMLEQRYADMAGEFARLRSDANNLMPIVNAIKGELPDDLAREVEKVARSFMRTLDKVALRGKCKELEVPERICMSFFGVAGHLGEFEENCIDVDRIDKKKAFECKRKLKEVADKMNEYAVPRQVVTRGGRRETVYYFEELFDLESRKAGINAMLLEMAALMNKAYSKFYKEMYYPSENIKKLEEQALSAFEKAMSAKSERDLSEVYTTFMEKFKSLLPEVREDIESIGEDIKLASVDEVKEYCEKQGISFPDELESIIKPEYNVEDYETILERSVKKFVDASKVSIFKRNVDRYDKIVDELYRYTTYSTWGSKGDLYSGLTYEYFNKSPEERWNELVDVKSYAGATYHALRQLRQDAYNALVKEYREKQMLRRLAAGKSAKLIS